MHTSTTVFDVSNSANRRAVYDLLVARLGLPSESTGSDATWRDVEKTGTKLSIWTKDSDWCEDYNLAWINDDAFVGDEAEIDPGTLATAADVADAILDGVGAFSIRNLVDRERLAHLLARRLGATPELDDTSAVDDARRIMIPRDGNRGYIRVWAHERYSDSYWIVQSTGRSIYGREFTGCDTIEDAVDVVRRKLNYEIPDATPGQKQAAAPIEQEPAPALFDINSLETRRELARRLATEIGERNPTDVLREFDSSIWTSLGKGLELWAGKECTSTFNLIDGTKSYQQYRVCDLAGAQDMDTLVQLVLEKTRVNEMAFDIKTYKSRQEVLKLLQAKYGAGSPQGAGWVRWDIPDDDAYFMFKARDEDHLGVYDGVIESDGGGRSEVHEFDDCESAEAALASIEDDYNLSFLRDAKHVPPGNAGYSAGGAGRMLDDAAAAMKQGAELAAVSKLMDVFERIIERRAPGTLAHPAARKALRAAAPLLVLFARDQGLLAKIPHGDILVGPAKTALTVESMNLWNFIGEHVLPVLSEMATEVADTHALPAATPVVTNGKVALEDLLVVAEPAKA